MIAKFLIVFVYSNIELLVNDHLLQLSLGSSSLNDLLVNSVGSDQSVDHDWFGLTNSVTSVLGL